MLPVAFSRMPAGQIFAIAFFAVLTSAVSMLEVCVAAVDEATGWTRRKTTVILTGIFLLVTLLPALSYSAMELSVNGIPLLDFMDETVGTLGLHIAAILVAVAFTSFISPQIFFSEMGSATHLYRIIFLLCKYVIPAALLLTIAGYLVTGIEIPGTSFIPGTPYIGPLPQVVGVALITVLILIAIFVAGKLRK